MGHSIGIRVVKKKEDIIDCAREFAFENVDPHENLGRSYNVCQMHIEGDTKPFDSEQEAEEYLLNKYIGYNDGAVRFREYDLKAKTKKQEQKEKKRKELREDLKDIQIDSLRTTKTMTCKCCRKKVDLDTIARKNRWIYVYGGEYSSRCPHCNKDLRTDKQIEKEKKILKNLKDTKEEIKALELLRRKKTFKEKWLVKIEVHC